jgi:hypothetical protein
MCSRRSEVHRLVGRKKSSNASGSVQASEIACWLMIDSKISRVWQNELESAIAQTAA